MRTEVVHREATPRISRTGLEERTTAAFSLVELCVLVGLLAVLGAFLLSSMMCTKHRSQQSGCAANLEQLNLAAQLWIHDNNGWLPPGAGATEGLYIAQPCAYRDDAPSHRALVFYLAPYLGCPPPDRRQRVAKMFLCPALERNHGTRTNATERVAYAVSAKGTGQLPNGTGLPFNPFGAPALLLAAPEPPRRLLDVQNFGSLSSVWLLADADKASVPSERWSEAGLLPEAPAHGTFRNYLFFDGHVTPSTISADTQPRAVASCDSEFAPASGVLTKTDRLLTNHY